MNTKLNPKKLACAATLLLSLHGKRMKYIRLLKLLYIADRESLRETGAPIVGGRFCAMDNGPLHSDIYNLIRGNNEIGDWSNVVRVDGLSVELIGEASGWLSVYEREKIQAVSEKFSSMADFDLVDLTHHFQEWRDNQEWDTSKPISLEDVLSAVGHQDRASEIANELRQLEAAAQAFNE